MSILPRVFQSAIVIPEPHFPRSFRDLVLLNLIKRHLSSSHNLRDPYVPTSTLASVLALPSDPSKVRRLVLGLFNKQRSR